MRATDGAGRPLSLVVTRLGANAAGLALAAGLFGGIVYATSFLPLPREGTTAAPGGAAVPTAAARPAPTLAPVATAAPVVTVAPTVAPTPAPTPPPSVAPAPPAVSSSLYQSGGKNYVALGVRPGTALNAPFGGRVTVTVYQFVGGQIVVGANDRTRPFFPYLILTSGDQRLTYRLGPQTTDSVLLVSDGQTVAAGEGLFRVVGSAPTSWNAFYDQSVIAQVLVSLTSAATGRDLDAAPLFR